MRLLTLAATLLLAAPASAVTYTLDLTGVVANTTNGSFTFGGRNYQTGSLFLEPFSPFTVVAGDVIEGRLTLDSVFTVPAAGEQFFGLNFEAADGSQPLGPDGSANMSGTLNFANTFGPTGLASDSVDGSCGNCLAVIIGQTPGGPFNFNSFTYSATVTGLNQPFDLGRASISYQLSDLAAVPEPASWAMIVVGAGLIGGTARRRKGVTRAVFA